MKLTHEGQTRKSGQWLQRQCLGKVASLIKFASRNDSTTIIRLVSRSLFISHLNTPFLHIVHFYLKAFYDNFLFSKRISNVSQKAYGAGGKSASEWTWALWSTCEKRTWFIKNTLLTHGSLWCLPSCYMFSDFTLSWICFVTVQKDSVCSVWYIRSFQMNERVNE